MSWAGVNYLEVRHYPADGGVHHIDGGDIGAVLSVGALRGRCRAVEHVLRVAHAILRRLELSAEGSRVLKLLHAAVLFCQSNKNISCFMTLVFK